MLTQISSTDLTHACRILFTPEISCPLAFVKNLDPGTLKTAFRKKALETHPDRAKALGIIETEQSRRFQEVKSAYDVLLPLAGKTFSFSINTPPRQPARRHRSKPFYRKRPRKSPKQETSFYTGLVPSRALKFGQFLYYSGVITWRQLICAIFWQRKVTRRYGQIALDWNIITHRQLMAVLKYRQKGELCGEFARRHGYVSDFQHLAILGKQRKCHRRLGEYFIDQNILTQQQLNNLLRHLDHHNKRHTFTN